MGSFLPKDNYPKEDRPMTAEESNVKEYEHKLISEYDKEKHYTTSDLKIIIEHHQALIEFKDRRIEELESGLKHAIEKIEHQNEAYKLMNARLNVYDSMVRIFTMNDRGGAVEAKSNDLFSLKMLLVKQ